MTNTDSYLRYADLEVEALTPMMQQYLEIKQSWPDCILFFRLGDFYEMFFDDALDGAKILNIALTQRECGQERKAPMCGVPYHAVDSYISRLLAAGKKVAICEQVENPALAKGLVKREVIRVVTPGTVTNPDDLDALNYRYLATIFQLDNYYGLAYADVSANSFQATEIILGNTGSKLLAELERLKVDELVVNRRFYESKTCKDYLDQKEISLSLLDDSYFNDEAKGRYGLSLEADDLLWTAALAALCGYLEDKAFVLASELPKVVPYKLEEYMILDSTARRHLEITETLRTRERRGSLLWALDKCETAMGSRLLLSFLNQPLMDLDEIRWRQNCIKGFLCNFVLRAELQKVLGDIYDLERLAGRLGLKQANPRDLVAIANILAKLPQIQELLLAFEQPALTELANALDPLEEMSQIILEQLRPDAPIKITDGGIFQEGADPILDELRSTSEHGNSLLLDYEQEEREKTGIKSLKLKYNRVFGYTIEVSKSYVSEVPDYFIRRQTLANAERYYTPELKAIEERILGAEQKLVILEQEMFIDLRDKLATHLRELQRDARYLALIDVFASQADLAEERNFVCPELVEQPILSIQDGRHPVVEKMLKAGEFVANDLYLDEDEQRLMILTGPNMAGKSTFMRQNALIVLMAQAGLFVPASQAVIGLCDRIFTRVGASDDLASGQSTFMVEMQEVAVILREATPQSLLILDEIGRGTSTWDGLSIAWAVIEHVAGEDYLESRCLFATHYHELTELAANIPGVFNAHVDITASREGLQFLHKVKNGGDAKSYGIEVAKLAQVPDSVIIRAREILVMLEKENQGQRLKIRHTEPVMENQLDIFSAAKSWTAADAILERLKSLDLNMLRPLDALAILAELQDLADGKNKG
ncbi:MAG: DNA mismatch repair protein MutS [Eubacteriales bacterium]|nr:DNA mismatch repair protein MutS [Eubacteriales bacterium]